MQGMIVRNEQLPHRSFLAGRCSFQTIPLLLRRAFGHPLSGCPLEVPLRLFPWMKKPSTAPDPQTNPFADGGDAASPQSEQVDVSEGPPARRGPGGRPVAENPRVKRVSMSLTEAEHAAWKAAAGDQPLSAWAREKVRFQVEADEEGPDGPDGSVAAEIRRLRGDLARVGSNLNQLARGMNQGQIVSADELTHVLSEVSSQLANLRKELP